jgi:hypothetical protein
VAQSEIGSGSEWSGGIGEVAEQLRQHLSHFGLHAVQVSQIDALWVMLAENGVMAVLRRGSSCLVPS